VLAVGGLDRNGRPWDGTVPGYWVDVAAPSQGIYWVNSHGETKYTHGTSDATALVSGAAALIWSQNPELTSREVTARLLAGLWDTETTGRDDATGWGAVRPLISLTQEPPTGFTHPILDELDAMGVDTQATPTTPPTTTTATPDNTPDNTSDKPNNTPLLIAAIAATTAGLLLIATITAITLTRRNRNTPPPTTPHNP
jgi:subtilisin family serine protease